MFRYMLVAAEAFGKFGKLGSLECDVVLFEATASRYGLLVAGTWFPSLSDDLTWWMPKVSETEYGLPMLSAMLLEEEGDTRKGLLLTEGLLPMDAIE